MKQYIAGFLDADGSVSLSPKGQISVEFYNCDIDLLKMIQKLYPGFIKTRESTNKKHNVSHTLIIKNSLALRLLEDVSPFMIHKKKKQRANLLVKYYKQYTPRNGKYTPELLEKKNWLIKEVKGIVMRGEGAY
jgi:hypothetical protein